MNSVYVFSSDRQGRHGKGAALHAVQKWGAIYGQAEGRQGNAYAIITKELRRDHPPVTLEEVSYGVSDFMDYAYNHQDTRFKVSAIGCGLAGFTPEQIAPEFTLSWGSRSPLPNVILPPEFKKVIKEMRQPDPVHPIFRAIDGEDVLSMDTINAAVNRLGTFNTPTESVYVPQFRGQVDPIEFNRRLQAFREWSRGLDDQF